MKTFKQTIFLALMIPAFHALAALPPVIDLKIEGDRTIGNDYIKTVSANESISYRFNDGRSHYVEQLFITAEGAQRNYSFAKVYADGVEIATLGIPGRDPDYPVVIRGEVSEITLKVQDKSRVRLLGFKIYTERKNYSSYHNLPRTERKSFNAEMWGQKVLDLIHEFQGLSGNTAMGYNAFTKYLKNLKMAAIQVQASDNVHDARSLSTKKKAEMLVDAIDAAMPLFESDVMVVDQRYDRLALDLQTIKQDIIEKYDLNRE